MKVVHKYPLYHGWTSVVVGGTRPKPVMFGVQHGLMYVWIEHEAMGGTTTLEFAVVGTGHSIDHTYTHVQSIQHADFVWHLYYK